MIWLAGALMFGGLFASTTAALLPSTPVTTMVWVTGVLVVTVASPWFGFLLARRGRS